TDRMPIAPQVLAAAFMVHPYYTGKDPFSVEKSRRRGVQRPHARTARRRPAPEEGRPDPAARSHDGALQDRARGLGPLRPRRPGAPLVPVDPPRDGAPAARTGRSAPHHLSGGGGFEGERGRIRVLPAAGDRRDERPPAPPPQERTLH